jgi:hypothetical protein
MKRFSKKWTYNILQTGVSKLLDSSIDNDIKEIVRTIPMFITINCQLKSTAGQLFVIRPDDYNVKKIPRDKLDWTVAIDGIESYLCMELSAHHIYWDSSTEIANTIIHECAHGINFADEGYESRPASDWHNESWKEIHAAMGSKPKIACNLQPKATYLDLYHEIAQKFEEEELS